MKHHCLNSAMLLRYDATEPEYVTPANGRKFTLKELQGFVEGYIEIVPLWANYQPQPRYKEMHLVVNEEGIPRRLPFNDLATRAAIDGGAISPTSRIYGNALLVRSKFID